MTARVATILSLSAGLILTSCATSTLERCADFTGTYAASGCHQRETKPLKDILLPDGTPLAGISKLSIVQTGCSRITISAEGRKEIELRPDDDFSTHWDDDGSLTGGTTPQSGGSILPGVSRTSREWHLSLSESSDGLVYSDAHDERGLALLLIPFHARVEAACDWLRASVPAPSR